MGNRGLGGGFSCFRLLDLLCRKLFEDFFWSFANVLFFRGVSKGVFSLSGGSQGPLPPNFQLLGFGTQRLRVHFGLSKTLCFFDVPCDPKLGAAAWVRAPCATGCSSILSRWKMPKCS